MVRVGSRIWRCRIAYAAGLAFLSISSHAIAQDLHSANVWIQQCEQKTDLCIGYIKAMIDMNALNKANNHGAFWCAPNGATLNQHLQIIVSEISRRPETWQAPFVELAVATLAVKFPCGRN